ncbi:MAG: PSD1 and planctomycete cytochrome C domain-containing protein [Candidatus Hydrogenedentota bacterium]
MSTTTSTSWAILALASIVATPIYAADRTIEFNRDVRPIISDKCFACHGPDANKREAELRLDEESGIFGTSEMGQPIVEPGDAEESELYFRITEAEGNEKMPPEDEVRQLTPEEIDTLKLWIEQGADWQGHWSFIPPEKPAIPTLQDDAWTKNEIDHFILDRLNQEGLSPTDEAPRGTIIRRVSLDLTGLPPTPEEIDAFINDKNPDAYERLVDRLLASPHYGERQAFIWLDAARYSDTNGYQRDTKRYMWHWRDWVIKAFNDNMPFDQFTIEQLAGDLLPNPTLSQKVATGFNRNHRINGEGGIIPEEYAVEYVADRVQTTGTTWMGLTLECSKCHDHKFDPFSQKEFYQFFAFFNSVPEEGKGRERGNDKPFIAVPSEQDQEEIDLLATEISKLKKVHYAPNKKLDKKQAKWEKELARKFATQKWSPLPETRLSGTNGVTLTRQDDDSILVSGENPDATSYTLTFEADRDLKAIQLEAILDDGLPSKGPGRAEDGTAVLSEIEVHRTPQGSDESESLTLTTALADFTHPKLEFRPTQAIDGDQTTGWSTGSYIDRVNRVAVFTLADDTLIKKGDSVSITLHHTTGLKQYALGKFRITQSDSNAIADWSKPTFSTWSHVGPLAGDSKATDLLKVALQPEDGFNPGKTYGDNNLRWEERPDWKDGESIAFETERNSVHYLHRTIDVEIPTTINVSLGSDDAIKVWLNGEVKLENNARRSLAPNQDTVELNLPQGHHELLIKIANYSGDSGYYFKASNDSGEKLFRLMDQIAKPADDRSDEVQRELQVAFRSQDAKWLARQQAITETRANQKQLEGSIVSTMIMSEMRKPRDTYLLIRGLYTNPDTSEKLYPAVPTSLGALTDDQPKNRLGLAQWLMNPDHPLTARVRVNHYWQTYFGQGIVKTSEDFGTQGTPPSHPELLDWLATRFIESGWDVNAMQKTIVMSATYRQKSNVTPEKLERDPENILLARAPRFRLSAEMVRDQALAVSGLLNSEIGGPSVNPYQPDNMWSALTFQNMDENSTNFYTADTGNKLYRRGLYTYWKRTILPPRMQIFDAADRERCSMRTERTNTPMQALVLMNDPTFIEASRHLAMRMLEDGGRKSEDRVRYGYKRALAYEPDPERAAILNNALQAYQEHFVQHAADAEALMSVGDSVVDTTHSTTELAAYTMLASTILNLDEMITRE